MSFRYRTIGYSPEYAITTPSSYNQFHNDNYFESDSSINLKLGSTTVAETGAVLRITDQPTNDLDVTNKLYVDNKDALKLNLTGGTLTGALTIASGNFSQTGAVTFSTGTGAISLNGNITIGSGKTLTLAADPGLALQAATKQYADTKLALTGGAMSGYITLHDHPSTSFHAATKAYVDGRLSLVDAGAGLYKTLTAQTNSATYSQTNSTITVTTTNDHGFATGTVVSMDFTSGSPSSPVDGSYAVTSTTGPKIFTIVAADSASRTGDATTSVVFTGISIASSGSGKLQVDADAVSLFATNPVSSNTTWYDQVKVDSYGRVTSAQTTPIVSASDGWYNKLRVQGGYVTQAESVAYLTGNQNITLSGDLTGSGTTSINAQLTDTGVTAGQYTKLTVNSKGRVTSATQLSASDVTTALGYVPPRESTVEFLHLKYQFGSSSWGTNPVPLVKSSGSIAGSSISGTYLYIPKGVYQITFYGANNWWYSYYSWWWWGGWWDNYWTYYYQPSIIYLDGTPQVATFSNYGGWWWYWNRTYYIPDRAQDFLITDVFNVTGSNSYFQFGLPLLSGVTYYYNIKVVKLK